MNAWDCATIISPGAPSRDYVVDPSPIMGGMGGVGALWTLTKCLSSPRNKCILCKFDILIMVVALSIIIFISSLTLFLAF